MESVCGTCYGEFPTLCPECGVVSSQGTEMLFQALPEPDRVNFACTKCGSEQFNLVQCLRDGKLDRVETKCLGCGKRGSISHTTKMVETVEIQEFMDWPPDEDEAEWAVFKRKA